MRRAARIAVGLLSGLSWGVGIAVLAHQFGSFVLTRSMLVMFAVGGAALSSLWAAWGSRRSRGAVVFSLVLAGAATASAQSPTSMTVTLASLGTGCETIEEVRAVMTGEPVAGCELLEEPTDLDETTAQEPFVTDRWTVVHMGGEHLTGDDVSWQLWIEFGGLRADLEKETYETNTSELTIYVDRDAVALYVVRGSGESRSVQPPWWASDLTSLTGIYHLGATVESDAAEATTLAGYVDFGGSPFTLIAALGALMTVGGLGGTWIAGLPTSHQRRRRRRRGARTARLKSDGTSIELDGVVVSSPGLDGELRVRRPDGSEPLAASSGWAQGFVEAFLEHHAELRLSIEIANARGSNKPVAIDVPPPDEGWGQFAITTDPVGVVTWCPPVARNDGRQNGYVIPWPVGEDDEGGSPRLLGEIGRTVMNVFVFPLLDPVFGAVGERFAAAWEKKRRPYRFRTFAAGDFDKPEADEPDWDDLTRGRALLMVHGTFSRAHTGFASLSKGVVGELEDIYEGRVFAFDHPTLSEDPRSNIEQLFARLPEGIELDIDIVSHSRGGLVSRVLAEKQAELDSAGRSVHVHKIVFAAVPNGGTILADPAHLGDMLDSYTNLMNFVATPLVADAVIAVVKHLAVGALKGLDGLQAMRPSGEFLTWLNREAGNQADYFGIAGDFEPVSKGWKRYAANRLMDGIFEEANDLIVPTAGVYSENGSSHFPISDRIDFGADDGVHHSGYFNHPTTRSSLLTWLKA